MRVNTSRDTVKYLAYEARTKGLHVTEFIGTGNVRCSNPTILDMFGYPDQITVGLGLEQNWPTAQTVAVRCRKCTECLRHRGRLWTARAIDETRVSTRTWFGTLTLAPDRQTWARYSALARIDARVSDNTPENVFKESVKVIAPEITRFLKRVRKVTPFRYLLVTEQHKSGMPHFHLLVHEYAGAITKKTLEEKWRFGFSHWRLVPPGDEKKCGYVAKYLAKSALTRVRASADYGRGALAPLTERVLQATRQAQSVVGKEKPVKGGDPKKGLFIEQSL